MPCSGLPWQARPSDFQETPFACARVRGQSTIFYSADVHLPRTNRTRAASSDRALEEKRVVVVARSSSRYFSVDHIAIVVVVVSDDTMSFSLR